MTGSIRCSSKRIILNAFEIFLTIFLILRSTPAKQSQRYTAGQMMVLRPDDITDKSPALLLAIDDNSVAHKNHFSVGYTYTAAISTTAFHRHTAQCLKITQNVKIMLCSATVDCLWGSGLVAYLELCVTSDWWALVKIWALIWICVK